MNITFLGCVSSTLGLAALGIICGGLSAQAETTSAVADPAVTPLVSQNQAPAQANPAPDGTLAEAARSAASETSVTASSESTNPMLDSQLVLEPSDVLSQDSNAVAVDSTVEQSELTASDPVAKTEMMPEAASQAAASNLLADSTSQISEATATPAATVAQTIPSEVSPGRATASSPSYFGIGGNFGVSGSSALGNQSLVLLSKIGITRFFSVRPSVYVDFDDDATFLIPVTIDLPATSLFIIPGIEIAPYVGGGLAASTSDGIGGSVIAGIDWPIASQFTVTSGVNLGFIDDFNLGVQIGIGYNFSGF